MKKNVGFLLWIFLSVFIASCTDVYKEDNSEKEKEIIPPGETYTPERKYNLNVIYYVPADIQEAEDWHYRLSGLTLHIQNYFYENFMRYRIDKKFGLELNDVNPEFVKVHYIKSNKLSLDMQQKNISEMAQEVLAYFEQHPELKQSDHYLVWMPEYSGSFISHYYPSTNQGMAFCGCVNDRFKISYFESARARATFLGDLGYVLKTFAQACFLPESDTGLDSPFRALMGATDLSKSGSSTVTYKQPIYNCYYYSGGTSSGSSFTSGTPDKIRLMLWDVRFLAGTQLFNDDYSYEPFEVEIKDVDIRSKYGAESTETDTLHVKCRFSTPEELVGVLLLDDPWRTYTLPAKVWDTTKDMDGLYESGWDAYGVYVDQAMFKKEGDIYEVEFEVPMVNHHNMPRENNSTVAFNHELRFRFIGKNGMAYPHPFTSIKGDFDSSLRYVYQVKGGGSYGNYYYNHDIGTKYGFWEREE